MGLHSPSGGYNVAMRRQRGGITAGILIATVLIWGSAAAADDDPASIVLITIDTLRADYLGSYGSTRAKTPTLDALAGEGVLFENAYCQVPLTPPSHASILTGTYPATHGLRDFTSGALGADLPTMGTLLQARGYQTAAFVSAFVLDGSWGFSRGFQHYFDDFRVEDLQGVNPGNVQRPANETLDQVLPWLETAREPFFLWVHLFDPHHDYRPPEPFRSLYPDDPYAGEVAWVDSQLARLVGVLKQQGRYGRTLIVATSDHGEGLGDHGEEEHGYFLYEEVIRIPLIFKLPARYGVRARRIADLVQSIDILPTVLQVLEIPQAGDSAMEGRGLLSAMLGKRSRLGFAYAETLYPWTTFGWSPLFTFREGDYKLVRAPQPELYDLQQDSREGTNLFSSRAAVANRLQESLSRLESSFSAPKAAGASPLADSDALEKLGALGYLAVGQPVAEPQALADPKQKFPVYQQVLRGLQAAEASQLDRSTLLLEAVARQNPELFIVHFSLGKNHLKSRQPERALEALDRAHQLNPGFAQIDLLRAEAYAMKGDLPGAVRQLEPLLKDGRAPLKGLQQLASLYQQMGRFEEAEGLWRRVLEKRAGDDQAVMGLGISLVQLRRYAEGLGFLDEALEKGSTPALIENFRGIALANLNRRPEALTAYRQAIASNPTYAHPRLNLALTLLQMGEREEAQREFSQLCRLDAGLCQRFRDRFDR